MPLRRAKTIVVEDYDPTWPATFNALRTRLLTALGDTSSSIEHVGSTAVPGLPAKPVIDLDIVVRAASDVPVVIARLAAIGYEHRGQLGIEGREAFRAPADLPPHHLYLCVEGTLALVNHLAVRDALRSRPDMAARYGDLKKQLAVTFARDPDQYSAGKTRFLSDLLREAGLSEEQLTRIRQVN